MKTREQIELRDRKELSARHKQLAKPDYKLYLLVLCIVVILIHIVDEIATNTPSMVESNAVKQFFPNLDLSTRKAALVAIMTPLGAITMLMPFYKALSDKFGRKIFLVLNTLGFDIEISLGSGIPVFFVNAQKFRTVFSKLFRTVQF